MSGLERQKKILSAEDQALREKWLQARRAVIVPRGEQITEDELRRLAQFGFPRRGGLPSAGNSAKNRRMGG